MSLFLAGDYADPTSSVDVDFLHRVVGEDESFLFNLEGPVLSEDERSANNINKYNLYSSPSFLKRFQEMKIICSLANNHINDFQKGLFKTEQFLNKNEIPFLGTSTQTFRNIDNFGVFAFNSPLTLPYHNKNIAKINQRDTLTRIKDYSEKNPEKTLIVYAHFGFELSSYPLPMDRNFCKNAIDAGADYVVGHHPHVIQGYENYNQGHIFYSLGNFALPQVQFLDKKLEFHKTEVNQGIIVEVKDKKTFKIHKTEMNVAQTEVNYLGLISLNGFKKKYGLSEDMSLNYSNFFNKNNTLPLYYPSFKNYETFDFYMKYKFVLFSQFIRKKLISLNLYDPY